MTVLHAESTHKDCTVSVRVGLKLQCDRNVITLIYMLKGLLSHDALAVFHENGLVLGCLDRRARIPAELVA